MMEMGCQQNYSLADGAGGYGGGGGQAELRVTVDLRESSATPADLKPLQVRGGKRAVSPSPPSTPLLPSPLLSSFLRPHLQPPLSLAASIAASVAPTWQCAAAEGMAAAAAAGLVQLAGRARRAGPSAGLQELSFCRHPLSIVIETPTEGRGGCSRMTEFSPTARSGCRSSRSRRRRGAGGSRSRQRRYGLRSNMMALITSDCVV